MVYPSFFFDVIASGRTTEEHTFPYVQIRYVVNVLGANGHDREVVKTEVIKRVWSPKDNEQDIRRLRALCSVVKIFGNDIPFNYSSDCWRAFDRAEDVMP
ncbi:hypothetical protein COOONC_06180 [Cooperia oncophora]